MWDNDGLTAFDIARRCPGGGNEAIPALFYQSILELDEHQTQAGVSVGSGSLRGLRSAPASQPERMIQGMVPGVV